jgi:hypothetical protein
MITVPLRGIRRQSRTHLIGLVSRSRAAAGKPSRATRGAHSTKRVVVTAAPLLMMMTLRIIELSTGRERALTESQMMIVLMMRRRLRRRRHL